MENYFRVTAIGGLVERTWKPDNGEEKTIASVEVTLSNGLDSFVAEANDDLARNLVKQSDEGKFDFNGFFRARVRMKVVKSKDKGLNFNNIRLLELNQL